MKEKLKLVLHFRNGLFLEKVIDVNEENAKTVKQIVDAIRQGFRDGSSFQVSLFDMIVRGDDLVAVEFEEA